MATLEERTKNLEEQVHMEAGLAASRDNDLSAMKSILNSHTGMLQGLQERQAEQSDTLNELSLIASGHSVILTQVTGILKEHTHLQYRQSTTLREHTVRLETLEKHVRSLEKETSSLRQATTEGFSVVAGKLGAIDDKFAALGGQLQVLIEREGEPQG